MFNRKTSINLSPALLKSPKNSIKKARIICTLRWDDPFTAIFFPSVAKLGPPLGGPLRGEVGVKSWQILDATCKTSYIMLYLCG
jgi:hypothetical protein